MLEKAIECEREVVGAVQVSLDVEDEGALGIQRKKMLRTRCRNSIFLSRSNLLLRQFIGQQCTSVEKTERRGIIIIFKYNPAYIEIN